MAHLPHPKPWQLDCDRVHRAGGEAGLTKMTLPTAFTTAVLAWGLLTFPRGYSRSKTTAATVDEVRWGAQYLLSAIGGEDAPFLVSQVRPDCKCLSEKHVPLRRTGRNAFTPTRSWSSAELAGMLDFRNAVLLHCPDVRPRGRGCALPGLAGEALVAVSC